MGRALARSKRANTTNGIGQKVRKESRPKYRVPK